MDNLKTLLTEKRSNLVTNVSFQKRWTINSIKNFPKVLQTPNILHNIDKNVFKDKPAIIVAAGPSLSDEFESLRTIKEQGLAYIFSVGSSINALIEHDILPDAACTYDPTDKNQYVFEKLKVNNVTNVPLIFGSSTGFEVLENYPGEMIHMIMNQDTVAQYYLENIEKVEVVNDAPSIAVVTFQLLRLLGFKQIILVGQNLAFKNNVRYADGIKYDFINNDISIEEEALLTVTKDVHGNIIQTNEGFNRMRQQLEMYIRLFKDVEVFNTTNGGAHIEGAIYKPLNELINEKLSTKNLVVDNWYKGNNHYNLEYIKTSQKNTSSYRRKFEEVVGKAVKELKRINIAVKTNKVSELEKNFTRFDKEFHLLSNNPFYIAFIDPMVRVHKQRLIEETKEIQFEKNLHKKGRKIADIYSAFLIDCMLNNNLINVHLNEAEEEIFNIINGK